VRSMRSATEHMINFVYTQTQYITGLGAYILEFIKAQAQGRYSCEELSIHHMRAL
jgi:hypothetical protein